MVAMGECAFRSVLAFAHFPVSTDLRFELLLEIGYRCRNFSWFDSLDLVVAGVPLVVLVIVEVHLFISLVVQAVLARI